MICLVIRCFLDILLICFQKARQYQMLSRPSPQLANSARWDKTGKSLTAI